MPEIVICPGEGSSSSLGFLGFWGDFETAFSQRLANQPSDSDHSGRAACV